MLDRRGLRPHRLTDRRREFVHRPRLVRTDVVHLVPRVGALDAGSYDRRDIVNIAKRPHLLAVSKDRKRLASQYLPHEDADDIAVWVSDVLVLAIHVVRAEYDVVEPEHLLRFFQVKLHRILRNPVWILRLRHQVFDHRRLVATVHRNRRREDKALHRSDVDRRIDKIHATDEVVLIVEVLDEMAQSLGCIGCKMEHIRELLLLKERIHKRGVLHAAFYEFGAFGDILDKSARKVVHHDNPIARIHEPFRHMRTNKSGAAGYEYRFHSLFSFV